MASNSQGELQMKELQKLLKMATKHKEFMKMNEFRVDRFINKRTKDKEMKKKLRDAKEKALETEHQLLSEITDLSALNTFLSNIILIENLFNSFYSNQEREKQQNARKQYAPNIEQYENAKKPKSDVASFIDLMTSATKTHVNDFDTWLNTLENECKKQDIKLKNSGAKCKGMERAFYKTFYVYCAKHGENGFKELTDVLRCSIVFDNFDDLYRCFSIIENLSKQDGNEGI
eukprot:270246_1